MSSYLSYIHLYSSPSTGTIYYKLTAELIEHCTKITVVLSVRYEVGVSLLLAPARADKRGPKALFPLVETAGIQPVIQESTRRSFSRSRVLLKALRRGHGFKFRPEFFSGFNFTTA